MAQTYLNTAAPGNGVGDWPSPHYLGAFGTTSTPYGECGYASGSGGPGANSTSCAYIYGYDMVDGITTAAESIEGDAPYFAGVAGRSLGGQPIWLDVETANSWQSGTAGQAMNVAVLQGMVDALKAGGGAQIGIYSTTSQWDQITGTPTSAGNLTNLPVWIPGARKESDAQANCSLAGFTGGSVLLAQWFAHPYDGAVSCTG